MSKIVLEAKAILQSMLHNHSQWNSERAPNLSRKINSIEEVNPLSNKIDGIFSYISKQNIESVPLQELVGNTNENVDVNYIRNFGNNGYGNNYNNSYSHAPYAPNKYISANNNSSELENTIRSFISTKKELNKEFIEKFERQDSLNEKVDLLTQEVISFKNLLQQKNHEETIKYVQVVIDKSWETLNFIE
jgi:hypothetical protein